MRRHLDLNGLEADAQVLELLVILTELALPVGFVRKTLETEEHGENIQIGDAVLEKDDALCCALGTLNEEAMDVLTSQSRNMGAKLHGADSHLIPLVELSSC